MKDINRVYRIANEIRRNIAIILQFKIRDPRVVGMVTVLGIDVSRDFSYAKVFVTFLNSNSFENDPDEKIKILRKASGFIRRLLAQSMLLRIVPELFFVYDDSIVDSMRVYRLLTKVNNDNCIVKY